MEEPKNHNLESVSAKNVMFFSLTPYLPTSVPALGPPRPSIRVVPVHAPSPLCFLFRAYTSHVHACRG
jgi:hypothetical protein